MIAGLGDEAAPGGLDLRGYCLEPGQLVGVELDVEIIHAGCQRGLENSIHVLGSRRGHQQQIGLGKRPL